MSSKKVIIIFVVSVIVLFFGGFLIYKAAIVKTANNIILEDDNSIDRINSAITLAHDAKILEVEDKSKNSSINYESINYENLYASKIYDDFEVENESTYTKYYNDDKSIDLVKYYDKGIINMIVEQYEPLVNESISAFVKKNNLNDYDSVLNYLYNHRIETVDLFTTFTKIGENNILHSLYDYVAINPNNVKEYYKLSGNVKGHLSVINGNVIMANLDDEYAVYFRNFTLDEALDFLGYVHISSDDFVSNDREGMYYLLEYEGRRVYSDEENPLFFDSIKNLSIKEFLPKSNCTLDCIHNYSDPVATYKDGGSQLYKYKVDNETYYMIKCNKLGSTYNDGTDVIISKNGNNLANMC